MFEKKTSLGAVGGIETKTNGLDAFPLRQPLSTTQELSILREKFEKNCKRSQGLPVIEKETKNGCHHRSVQCLSSGYCHSSYRFPP